MQSAPLYDVLIVGGGPAGSSAALRTRSAGLSTLVVEKLNFPRFRIGESLLPEGNALLREIGVWDAVAAAGFIPKYGARFYLADGEAEKKVDFSTGLIPGLEQTFQVDRARFDSLLLDRARAAGAEVRAGTTVRELQQAEDHCLATIQSDDGRTTVRTRYVIDASGRDQFFPSELKSSPVDTGLRSRIAIYNHFTGVPREPGPAAGDTVIVRLPDGWFWIIPIDAERTSVGLVTTRAAFKADGRSPAQHFDAVVARAPRLRSLMAGAVPLMDYQVTADYSYARADVAHGRVVMAGDAAGFLDPIFSSGVYLALRSAKYAAELVVRAHRENRAFRPVECARLKRENARPAGVFHRLIRAFYDDDSFSVFMCPRPPWGLAPTITSIVAGHADLTWKMRWRFAVFLLVCRLQRRLPLVPRIALASPTV